ncbi:hypothetical protein ANO11243_051440 [Dothideomycetidae sp. 11243]|nr:hypothetical protein ANO11243_051440 [fungal sp. No.11243]
MARGSIFEMLLLWPMIRTVEPIEIWLESDTWLMLGTDDFQKLWAHLPLLRISMTFSKLSREMLCPTAYSTATHPLSTTATHSIHQLPIPSTGDPQPDSPQSQADPPPPRPRTRLARQPHPAGAHGGQVCTERTHSTAAPSSPTAARAHRLTHGISH